MALETGKKAEDVAAAFLERRGLKIVAKNVVYPFGELDLVALHNKTLVFVEVKYRHTLSYGFPEESITRSKQRKVALAAEAFLQKYQGPLPYCRFDVISMWGNLGDPVIEHIEDAFCLEDF
ncbi:MAG TPA: YraN family protein [Myxococcota bacterium]|nr:YraN family protein [Myxococcota bacterium]